MTDFKKYKRTQIAEMRPVTDKDISDRKKYGRIPVPNVHKDVPNGVSISQVDFDNGSPKIGDMIARNPNNHQDQWLVAEQYFKENFEES